MKVTIKQLSEMITRAILQEVDARKIPRWWFGTYAFVLAYNQGLKEGLFPRNQPIEIEFTVGQKNIWANGMLTIDITSPRPNRDFFTGGPGHDLLHGLTQNSQPHFGTFPKNDLSVSTGNKSDYRYRNIKRAFDSIKKDFGVDLTTVFGKNSYTGEVEDFTKKIESYLLKKTREAQGEDLSSDDTDKWEKIYYRFDSFTRPSNYFSNNHIKKGGKNNPTHAIEEEIGNVVSDQLASFLANSEPIDRQVVAFILDQVDRWEEASEFGFYDNPSNEKTIQRWKQHMRNVLPRFVAIYNQKLAMLEKTNLGSVSSVNV
jgi:hypothetical protein